MRYNELAQELSTTLGIVDDLWHTKMGKSREVSSLTAQQVNFPAFLHSVPFTAGRQAGKLRMSILKSSFDPTRN